MFPFYIKYTIIIIIVCQINNNKNDKSLRNGVIKKWAKKHFFSTTDEFTTFQAQASYSSKNCLFKYKDGK